VPSPPSTHMSQQRDELYGCLGKAVNCLLFVSWVAGSRQQAGIHKVGEPACQNVRCDALFREPDKISKVPAIPKHYIPDDDQAPAVSEHLECQIDRAAGATLSFHSVIPAPVYCMHITMRPIAMTPLALCKLTIIEILRAAISRVPWTKTSEYHLRFATASYIFDTTCMLQVVWSLDKFELRPLKS
jgi:hypothetical protein